MGEALELMELYEPNDPDMVMVMRVMCVDVDVDVDMDGLVEVLLCYIWCACVVSRSA
jgi:hypothetical protein